MNAMRDCFQKQNSAFCQYITATKAAFFSALQKQPFRSVNKKDKKIKSATIYLGFTTEECQNTTGPLKPLKAFSMNVQSNRRATTTAPKALIRGLFLVEYSLLLLVFGLFNDRVIIF